MKDLKQHFLYSSLMERLRIEAELTDLLKVKMHPKSEQH